MVELDAHRVGNEKDSEVKVDVSSVYKELITLAKTHPYSE